MLHLSWVTFQKTDDQGGDEVFRAHEVAHQWWGIGVDYLTYHDRWLSEGFAEFSGLWYMQTVRHSNDKYFAHAAPVPVLHLPPQGRARSDFPRAPGPVVPGRGCGRLRHDRLQEGGMGGAHAAHADARSQDHERGPLHPDDAGFLHRAIEGKRASTADFRRVVERHTGADMGWFFDQWVYGTALPTYRVAYRTEPMEDGQFRVRLQVQQEGVPDRFLMYVPVTLDLGKDRVARVRVKVTGATHRYRRFRPCPRLPRRCGSTISRACWRK